MERIKDLQWVTDYKVGRVEIYINIHSLKFIISILLKRTYFNVYYVYTKTNFKTYSFVKKYFNVYILMNFNVSFIDFASSFFMNQRIYDKWKLN